MQPASTAYSRGGCLVSTIAAWRDGGAVAFVERYNTVRQYLQEFVSEPPLKVTEHSVTLWIL